MGKSDQSSIEYHHRKEAEQPRPNPGHESPPSMLHCCLDLAGGAALLRNRQGDSRWYSASGSFMLAPATTHSPCVSRVWVRDPSTPLWPGSSPHPEPETGGSPRARWTSGWRPSPHSSRGGILIGDVLLCAQQRRPGRRPPSLIAAHLVTYARRLVPARTPNPH